MERIREERYLRIDRRKKIIKLTTEDAERCLVRKNERTKNEKYR